jgi:hypothetical protein
MWFENIMERLCIAKLKPFDQKRKEQLKIYYEKCKWMDKVVLEKTIEHLIESTPEHTFPTLGQLRTSYRDFEYQETGTAIISGKFKDLSREPKASLSELLDGEEEIEQKYKAGKIGKNTYDSMLALVKARFDYDSKQSRGKSFTPSFGKIITGSTILRRIHG